MADKVLTLTNKDGTDNIYPIAGGMMANSISTAMLQDGAVTSDKIDSTTLRKLAYLPGDTIAIVNGTAFITTYGAGANNKISVRIALNKSLDFVNGVTMQNGAVNTTYGFLINSSGQTTGINPRLAANQTVTGKVIPGFGVMANFQADVGASALTAWSMGILMIGDFVITFS